jgi:uncharacterized membrane protein YfcA
VNLPFDLGPAGLAWLALASFIAAWVRGYSGFGFGAILISAGALAVNPLKLVAVAILADLLMTGQMWRSVRGSIDWRKAGGLFLGALVGLPLGLWLLTGLSESVMRLIVALWVLAMGMLLLRGWELRVRGAGVVLGTGVISGGANAAGVGGLPVVALLAAQAIPPVVFRATLVAYFLLLDLWTLPLLWLHGLFDADTVLALAVLAPALIAGTWAGGRRFGAAKPQDFRRFAIVALIALAALGLIRALI